MSCYDKLRIFILFILPLCVVRRVGVLYKYKKVIGGNATAREKEYNQAFFPHRCV